MSRSHIKFLDLRAVNERFAAEFHTRLSQVLERGWFLNGTAVDEFEKHFAAYCRVKHCIGVGNGLDALTLVLQARKDLAGWNDGDEVIVPAYTFIASAQAVVRAGLRPIPVDVRLTDFLLDPALAEAALTARTRALMPVHLYGRLCDMAGFRSIADRHGLFLIEDAAQAHGTIDAAGSRAGSFGDAAAFSFYPGKNLGALGDGGAVVTSDDALAARVRTLANYGATTKYHHQYQGFNSRLDEIQAAFLSVKLHHLDDDNRRRQAVAARYLKEIDNEHLILPYSAENNAYRSSVFHIFPIRCAHRECLQVHLARHGIETLIHYPLPLHRQPCLRHVCDEAHVLPNAERIAEEELSLPISPVMDTEATTYVIQTLNSFAL